MERFASTVEPQIQVPAFFKPKVTIKRQKSGVEKKLLKLEHFERYLTLVRYNNEAWLRKRGKAQYTGFTSTQRHQLKQLFTELDTEATGVLTIDELFDPFLALNLVQSKAQLKSLFKCKEEEENPVIDLEEFQAGLEAERAAGSNVDRRITGFIRPSPLPYRLRLSCLRRKAMIQATSPSPSHSKSFRLYSEERTSSNPLIPKADILIQKKLNRFTTTLTPRNHPQKSPQTPQNSRSKQVNFSRRPATSGLHSPTSFLSSR